MAEVIGFKIEIVGTEEQSRQLGILASQTKKVAKDTKEFEQALKRLEQEEVRDEQAIRKVNTRIGENIKKKLQLSQQTTKLRQEIRQEITVTNTSANTIGKVNAQLAIEKRRIKEVIIGSNGFKKTAKRIRELEKRQRAFNKELGRGSTFVGEYEKGIIGAFKNIGLAVGGALIIFRGFQRIVGGGIEVITDFEKSITNVFTLLSEADQEQLSAGLSAGAVQIMKDYGFAIEDTNKALFDTVSAGIPASHSIEFLNQVSILAVGGVTDLATAVDGVTTVVNAFGLEVSDTERVTSAFFTAQKFGKTTVEELAISIGQVAPIANQAGVSFEELLAVFAELTKQGIDTTLSATAIKSTLVALIAPSKDAQKEFTRLGIPFGAAGLKAEGLAKILGKVAEASEEDADALSRLIPNIRALTGVGALGTAQLEEMDMILKEITTDVGENSSLTRAYEKQHATLAHTTERLNAQMRALVIELGEKLKPIMSDILHVGVSFLNSIKDNAGAIKDVIKVIGKAITAYASWRLIMIAVKFAQTKLTGAYLDQNVVMKIGTFLTKLWRGSMLLATAGVNLLRGNTVRATVAMRAFNIVTKANPIGLLVGVLVTAIAVFASFGDAVADSTDELDLQREAERKLRLEKEKRAVEDERALGSLDSRLEKLNELDKVQTEQLLRDINARIESDKTTEGASRANELRIRNAKKNLETSQQEIDQLKLIDDWQKKIDEKDVSLLVDYSSFAEAQADLNEVIAIEAQWDASILKRALVQTKTFNEHKNQVEQRLKFIERIEEKTRDSDNTRRELTEAELKAVEKLRDAQLKLFEDIVQANSTAFEKENKIYQKKKALLEKDISGRKITERDARRALSLLETEHQKNMAKIRETASKKRTTVAKKELQETRKFLDTDLKIAIRMENERFLAGKLSRMELNKAIKLLNDQRVLDELELVNRELDQSVAMTEGVLDINLEKNKVLLDRKEELLQKLAELDIDNQEEQLEREREFEDQKLELRRTAQEATITIVNGLLDRQAQITAKRLEKDLALSEKVEAKKLQALQRRFDQGLISEHEFETAKNKIVSEGEAERLEIQKEASEKQKKIDIAQAIISGALAVMRILETKSPSGQDPLTALLIKLAAVATIVGVTALQIDTIQRQSFAQGGRIPGTFDAKDDVPIRVSRGEAIVTPAQQSALGGAGAFRQAGVPGFATGGIPMPSANLKSFRSIQLPEQGLTREEAVDLIQEGIGTLKVEQVETETREIAKQVDLIETTAEI